MSALKLASPLPGLGDNLDFVLEQVPGADGLHSLTPAKDSSYKLFLVEPGSYVPDYAPKLGAEHLASIGVKKQQDARVLVVARTGDDGTTVNLLAPVIVNADAGIGAQVILDGTWSTRQQLG